MTQTPITAESVRSAAHRFGLTVRRGPIYDPKEARVCILGVLTLAANPSLRGRNFGLESCCGTLNLSRVEALALADGFMGWKLDGGAAKYADFHTVEYQRRYVEGLRVGESLCGRTV